MSLGTALVGKNRDQIAPADVFQHSRDKPLCNDSDGAESSFGHVVVSKSGWFRRAVCCLGAVSLGVTSLPHETAEETPSRVLNLQAHASVTSAKAVTRDAGMMR